MAPRPSLVLADTARMNALPLVAGALMAVGAGNTWAIARKGEARSGPDANTRRLRLYAVACAGLAATCVLLAFVWT
jgi:hypothetical protein